MIQRGNLDPRGEDHILEIFLCQTILEKFKG